MKLFIIIIFFMILSQVAYAQNIVFIVNEKNPLEKITRTQLIDLFLKNSREWKDGNAVRFVDRSDESLEKKIFLKNYVMKSSRQIEQHWIGQKLYTGDSAPSQVPSDNMVVALVSRFPGGIGYVSEEFSGAKGVKVLEVVE